MTHLEPTTPNPVPRLDPDADLLVMIERHDVLWPILNGGEKPAAGLDGEAIDLERTITATPAFTAAGLEGKKRVIERAWFSDDDGIIAEILRQDAQRVG